MAKQKNNRNYGETPRKAASTVFQVGDFIQYDGAGTVEPSDGTEQLIGISNEEIQTTDADYAVARQLNASLGGFHVEFEIPVITGTATAALEGTLVDVDPTDPRGVDVTTSTVGQILVTKFISASLILGKIATV
jgi:hypothetical protein